MFKCSICKRSNDTGPEAYTAIVMALLHGRPLRVHYTDGTGNPGNRLWHFNFVDRQWNMSFLGDPFTAQPVLVMAELSPLQTGFLRLQLFLLAWREAVGVYHSVLIDARQDQQGKRPKKRQSKHDGNGSAGKRRKGQT